MGNIICDGCLQGKTNNKSYKISETRASYPLELIHADLMEMPITLYYKHKYIVMIFDDYSSFATCTLIRSKSETLAAIKSFITAAELKLNSKVKSFRSDRGGGIHVTCI